MRARLTTGEVVSLEKDCDCLPQFHDGPHWLYNDDLWKARNQRLLDAGNVRGFLQEDIVRLREKAYQLHCRSIEEIIRD